jgi:hypothetical protein
MDVDAYYFFGYDITDDVQKIDLDEYEGDFESYAYDRYERFPKGVSHDSVNIHGNHHREFIHIGELCMSVDWRGRNVATQFVDGGDLVKLTEYVKALNDALEAVGISRRDAVLPSRILALKVY